LLEISKELKRWKKRAPANHGFGVALIHKSPTTSAASSKALLRINANGKIDLMIGATDVGGGSGTSLGQIAAEALGIAPTDIRVIIADTDLTPFDHGTYSSRVTAYVGAAVKLAAEDARRQLLELASHEWNISPDMLGTNRRKVLGPGGRAVTFDELMENANVRDIVGSGSFESKRSWAGDATSENRGSPSAGWPFGAQLVEIAIDRDTGVIKLVRVASAHDVGKAINPMAVTGQIQGGIAMGLGYALFEGLQFEGGRVTNASFADYKIAGARDMPAATPIIVEKPYTSEPYGAKGVGEMSVFGIAPAIANAIASLTGVRIKDLPMSAEKLFERLKESSR
jgi:CO/xanthine dehydrogenase Mo-binding subunit